MDYNAMRRREQKNIEKEIQSDRGYKGRLTKLYNRVQKDVQKEITSELENFAKSENLSMAEARKIANKTDVEAFQETAKQYVKQKDFSPRANRELKKYNVTMRTNRLELLEARINLATIDLASEEDSLLQEHIEKALIKEYERQSGILDMSVPSKDQLKRMLKSIDTGEQEGVTYSDYVWENQADLRDELNRTVRRSVIRGENPRKAGRELRGLVDKEFKKKKYAADRIAITETARIQSQTQEQAFKDAGIDKRMWIAEPSACDMCEELDGEVFNVGETEPSIPRHPFCKCSWSAYVE